MKKGIVVIFLLITVFLTGCPTQHLRTNGVYSMGPLEPSHELYLIAQVYYQTPPPGFHPAEFIWTLDDKLNGNASLTVFNEKDFNILLLQYDFSFNISDLTIQKTDEKIIYQGTLLSNQDISISIDIVVEEYDAEITENNKTFYFDRRVAHIVLYKKSEILGYFKGATMNLKKWAH